MVKVVDDYFARVAARYPYSILVHTVDVWCFTVGADDTAEQIREDAAPHYLEAEHDPDDRKREFLGWLERHAEARLDDPQASDMPMETAYDPYIPWVAQFLYGLWTRYEAAALQFGVSPGDGFTLPTPIWQTVVREHTRRGQYVSPAEQAKIYYDVYYEAVGWLEKHLRLLADWATARDKDLSPYHNVDELKTPLKAAKKWAQKKARKAPIVEGTVLHTYPDGWTMQLLDTPEALVYEGEYLRHCVADYADLRNAYQAIYALRGPDGRPVVTIDHDLAEDWYKMVRTFADAAPSPELFRRVACFRLKHDPPQDLGDRVPPSESYWPWHMWRTGAGDEIASSDAAQEMGMDDELVQGLIDQEFWRWYDVCKPVWWQ